jgi:hypothetical protein
MIGIWSPLLLNAQKPVLIVKFSNCTSETIKTRPFQRDHKKYLLKETTKLSYKVSDVQFENFSLKQKLPQGQTKWSQNFFLSWHFEMWSFSYAFIALPAPAVRPSPTSACPRMTQDSRVRTYVHNQGSVLYKKCPKTWTKYWPFVMYTGTKHKKWQFSFF